VAAAHDLVEDLDGEVLYLMMMRCPTSMACTRANRLRPFWRYIWPTRSNNTYTDHRPVVPLANRTTNSWGSWPSMIDANLGGGAIVPIHARVDGDAQFEPGEVNGDGLGR
jgi:hypothetical protein